MLDFQDTLPGNIIETQIKMKSFLLFYKSSKYAQEYTPGLRISLIYMFKLSGIVSKFCF